MTALINGVNYSWSNISVVLFGVPVKGITKISYKRKQKKENNYGAGSEPVSRGWGNSEYEASMELYVDELRKIIAASGGDPLSIAPFNIQVVFGGSRATAQTDTLTMCEFTEDSLNAAQGDTKLLVEIPLIIGGITHT